MSMRRTFLRSIFDAMDVDGSGSVSADELIEYSDDLGLDGMTPLRVRKMIDEADTDGDGEVDFDEFCVVRFFLFTRASMCIVRRHLSSTCCSSGTLPAVCLPVLYRDTQAMETSKKWQGCITPSLLTLHTQFLDEADGAIAMVDGLLGGLRRQVAEQTPMRIGAHPLSTTSHRVCVRTNGACVGACKRR